MLTSNSAVSGTLAEGDCRVGDILAINDQSLVDLYRFTLSSNTEVVVGMTSSNFDTFLRLTDSNFSVIEQDDDSGEGFNSEISVSLNAGTYFVLANSATNSEELGAYGLSLTTNGALSSKLSSNSTIELLVVGESLTDSQGNLVAVPESAIAVSINVTVVKASGGGHITVFPCGVPEPTTSNINYVEGQIVANGIIAPVGANGKVCFTAFRETDIIVDIAGWFEGDGFVGATPKRLVDSRIGTGTPSISRIGPNTPLQVRVTDLGIDTAAGVGTQVPFSINAAALNVTAVKPVGAGHLTVYPCGAATPEASNLNYVSSQVVANGVIAQPSSSGDVCVFAFRDTDVIVDMAGWFTSGFVGATPKRLLDTRVGIGGRNSQLQKDEVFSVPVRGIELNTSGVNQSVPNNASAVALNVTVVRPVSSGHVTVWPCGVDMPLASNLNYLGGNIIANNVIAPIGADGSVCLSTFAAADVIVDIAGWFESTDSDGFFGTVPKRLVDTRVGKGPAPVLK